MSTRTSTSGGPTGRAHPLPPEERRLDIVTTAIAMLRRDHEMPSTRRLARECGIAEGTLFRAFATKDDLVDAILSTVGCPFPFRQSAAAIPVEATPTAAGLRDRLSAATSLLHRRFSEIFETLGPLGWMGQPPHHPHPGCPAEDGETLEPDFHRRQLDATLAPYRGFLAVDLEVLTEAMRSLAFSGAHHHLDPTHTMSPEVIVDLLLDGALAPDLRHTGRSRTTHDSEKESRC